MTLTHVDRTAHRAPDAPAPGAKFVIPSMVWYGLAAKTPSIGAAAGVPELEKWGGRIDSDAPLAPILKTLDPVLLLLNLAGYQVPEVAIGIPSGAGETPAGDLIAIDLRTMTYARSTQRPWTALGSSSAQVALWVEPRFPVGLPAYADGPTLLLQAVAASVAIWTIRLEFVTSGSGWLRLWWSTDMGDGWAGELGEIVDRLTEPFAVELEAQRAVAKRRDDGHTAPLCGLLSLYDVRTWRTPRTLGAPGPTSKAVAEFGANVGRVVDTTGLALFLTGEMAGKPVSVQDRWTISWTVDLGAVGSELQKQTDDLPLSAQDQLAFSDIALPGFSTPSITQVLLYSQELGVLDFLTTITEQVDAIPVPDRYGGFALALGDHDGDFYEGKTQTDRLPGAGQKGYVAQLRADLNTLGFGPQFDYKPNESAQQTFTLDLDRAVREFQIHARMPHLAEQQPGSSDFYGQLLRAVPNPLPFDGPISGVTDADTRDRITLWLNGNLRCPVVIEARTIAGQPVKTSGVVTDNLWRHAQLPNERVRMFARDFSGKWTLPADSQRDLEDFPLGDWVGGPRTMPPQVWAELEVKTESLIGKTIADLSLHERSTFRIVRALAELECSGYFDVVQAIDTGGTSVGLCHWTTAQGELEAYLALLQGDPQSADAYEALFGSNGCSLETPWPDGATRDASPCFKSGQRKYVSWVFLQDKTGAPLKTELGDAATVDWMRDWHWFARFSMTARTLPVFRRRMWYLTRLRLQDVLMVEWPGLQTQGHAATIGDVFTSERAVGLLLRWHVNRPGHLVPFTDKDGKSISQLPLILQDARAAVKGDWGDPQDWTDVHEAALHDALYKRALTHTTGIPRIEKWDVDGTPDWSRSKDFTLSYAELRNIPEVTGLAHAVTPANTPYETAFTAKLGDVRDGFQSTVDVQASPAGIVDVTIPASTSTLRATPRKAGDAVITVTADNGYQVGSAAFWLSVGKAKPRTDKATPSPPATAGLSLRRKSFLFDDTELT